MLTRVDSLGLAELESAHCYAAEFGSVLEWCTMATDDLFTGSPSLSRHRAASARFAERLVREESREERRARLTPWDRAAEAYSRVREARRVERSLSGEVA